MKVDIVDDPLDVIEDERAELSPTESVRTRLDFALESLAIRGFRHHEIRHIVSLHGKILIFYEEDECLLKGILS